MGRLAGTIAQGAPVSPKGERCSTCKWLDTLDDETRGEAVAMMADRSWTGPALRDAFRPLGLGVEEHSIMRHRRNGCQGG